LPCLFSKEPNWRHAAALKRQNAPHTNSARSCQIFPILLLLLLLELKQRLNDYMPAMNDDELFQNFSVFPVNHFLVLRGLTRKLLFVIVEKRNKPLWTCVCLAFYESLIFR
jgi:hypothetical protein